MDFATALEIGSNVTYGWRIASVASGGPSDGLLRVDDIVIAMNGTKIRNNDDLASYLEERTLPNDRLVITVARGTTTTPVTVVLGIRPAPS